MLRVTAHALQRYRERVAPVSEEEALAAILSHITMINIALAFGAPCVRCPNGMRIMLR